MVGLFIKFSYLTNSDKFANIAKTADLYANARKLGLLNNASLQLTTSFRYQKTIKYSFLY